MANSDGKPELSIRYWAIRARQWLPIVVAAVGKLPLDTSQARCHYFHLIQVLWHRSREALLKECNDDATWDQIPHVHAPLSLYHSLSSHSVIPSYVSSITIREIT